MVTETIGRFEIQGVLGQGAQGVVYKGYDPQLDRIVAIKAIGQHSAIQDTKVLLREARLVSKFSHPNIVSIYEAIVADDKAHLVFEFVEGKLLSQALKEKGRFSAGEALELMLPIIEGIAHAQEQNIIHCDLKPANVLMTGKGIPKIMDFGIGRTISEQAASRKEFFGTPRYMAPEYVAERQLDKSNDVFALGLIFYELIAGKPVFEGNDIRSILTAVLDHTPKRLSSLGIAIDEALEHVIFKALEKKVQDRYQSVGEMLTALRQYQQQKQQAYLQKAIDQQTSQENLAVEYLMKRIKMKQDFPALSQSIAEINRIIADDDRNVRELTEAVSKDIALTNKILKVINSSFYAQFMGGITSLKQAILLLGFKKIRSIVIALLVVDHLHNKFQAKKIREQVVAALYSGLFAERVAEDSKLLRNTEEVFLSAMFHQLGRIMATFYFYDEALEMERLMQEQQISEDEASQLVLGVKLSALSMAVASEWGLPKALTQTMTAFDANAVKGKLNESQKVHMLACFSNDVSEAIEQSDDGQWQQRIGNICIEYGGHFSYPEESVFQVLETVNEEILELNEVFDFDVKHTTILANLKRTADDQAEDAAETAQQQSQQQLDSDIASLANELAAETELKDSSSVKVDAMLSHGIDDIKRMIQSGDFALNDAFKAILDVMYQALNLDRALLCLANRVSHRMEAKLGMGKNMNMLINRFSFTMKYEADVFHVALDKGVDIFIQNTEDAKIKSRIPDWYRETLPSQNFIVMPLMLRNKPVGMFYIDNSAQGDLLVNDKEFELLKELRDQAVSAIKAKMRG